MMALRITCPDGLADEVTRMLTEHRAVAHLAVLPGAGRKPVGDLVLCDVALDGVDDVFARLRRLGVPDSGAVVADRTDVVLSEAAQRAERGEVAEEDTVVWDEVEQRTSDDIRLSPVFIAFMTVAMIIAAIGVVTDQPILIVGSMCVGPDFGPVAAICVAIVRRRARMLTNAVFALGVGTVVAGLLTILAALGLEQLGVIDRSMLTDDRPLTSFIWHPDALSWVVALLAGVAGLLSLTSSKSGALVGVVISVTTIPAAANAAVAAAFGVWHEALGSSAQLAINIACMIVAGTLTLMVQGALTSRGRRRRQRADGAPVAATRRV